MAQSTKKPSAPSKLPSKEQAAAVLAYSSDDEGEGEGTAVDQLRAHLVDAHESIGAALDLLDEIEAAEE